MARILRGNYSYCLHDDKQVIVFADWQRQQYDCPAGRVRYCNDCGQSHSDWSNWAHDNATSRPELRELLSGQIYSGPFQPVDDEPPPINASLPDGLDPRSREAAMIHWQQSLQH